MFNCGQTYLNISNNEPYVHYDYFFFFFFFKKILLFHLGNEILSLVVHWGMKVMDMTKKLTIRKLYWQKSQRVSSVDLALVCFQCFQNLFLNYKKLKQFARKRTITKNNCWNNNKIMKINRLMYNVWKELELMDQSMR